MSSNVRVAEDIGWDDGLEIPVANAENKKVSFFVLNSAKLNSCPAHSSLARASP